MKNVKKLLSLCAALCLLLTLWGPVSLSAATEKSEPFYFGRSILAQMSNGDALCYVYDQFVAGCEEMKTEIDISHSTYSITSTECSTIYQLLAADRPDFFWLCDGIGYSTRNGVVVKLKPKYPADVNAQKTALEQRVKELTADLDGKSDYEISLLLHDRVCEAVEYQSSNYDQSAVGALVMGEAVCAGYTRAYQILLQEMGISSYYVAGTSKGEGHAWNLVELDGEWYYTDVTWDDQGETIYYAYFNNTYSAINEDHTPTSYATYLPRATATANNYFVRNNLVLSSMDVNKVAAICKANSPARFYVTGDLATFRSNLNQGLSDVVKAILGVPAGYSASMSYMGREVILRLTINHTHEYSTSVTNPTCTTKGYTTYTCYCGSSYTDQEKAPLGHSFQDWWQTTSHHGQDCSRCGITKNYGEHEFNASGTCAAFGYLQPGATGSGDVNNDGKINNRDLGMLQMHVNDYVVNISLSAADMNGDGKINNRDLGLLQKLLNA